MLSFLTKTLITLTTVATTVMSGFIALHRGLDPAVAIAFLLLVCVLACSYMADNDPE